jgi:predicted enzyme related to lactoylglutathione lyase
MTEGMKTVIYPVHDLAAAKPLYTALLGTEPHTDSPYYVGYRVNEQEVALDPNGHAQGMTGPLAYWHVRSMDDALAAVTARGATITSPPRDVGGGKLVAALTDADGNALGLLQAP